MEKRRMHLMHQNYQTGVRRRKMKWMKMANQLLTKQLKELNNKIIECKWEDNQWVFMRERTDKSFPNGYNTAIGVINSIRDPVTKEILLDFIDHQRWRKPDSEVM